MLIITSLFLGYSCQSDFAAESTENWKQEILAAEQRFSNLAERKGIRCAFTTYMAEDAVLMRGNKLVIGAESISTFFADQTVPENDESLTWKPDFVDVAASGDLGYTYGKYIYSFSDSTGKKVEHAGVFHTVWKRQADGTWRFVWD